MKYIILADSDNVEPFIEPRQLAKINGEILIKRTIRLLKENGIKNIIITSHDPRFDKLGATRYEPLHNDYIAKTKQGYWLSAFPVELLNEPVTFLLGDVYYSDNAIKTIVESETDRILFFCTDKKQGYSEKYIKHHDEPLGFKVIDCELFLNKINQAIDMYRKGLTRREPIAWELYRLINDIDVNTHILTKNYIAINDESCDIDRVEDIMLLELKIGGNKMVRMKHLEFCTFQRFNELKEIVRANPRNSKDGELYVGDMYVCDKELAKYLANEENSIYNEKGKNNPNNRPFAKIIEVIPEETKPVKPVKKTTKKTTKKKKEG